MNEINTQNPAVADDLLDQLDTNKAKQEATKEQTFKQDDNYGETEPVIL